jgi:hypothetical protein
LFSVLPAFSQQKWERNYGGIGSEQGWEVQQTTDRCYIVAGFTGWFGTGAYLIKTNGSGDTLWSRIYGWAGGAYGSSVQQTSDGGYIITGASCARDTMGDVYLIKTNASGDTLWSKLYGGNNIDEGFSVRQTTDGGYIVAGRTYSFWIYPQIYLIKTNATGDTLWTRAYKGANSEYGRSVQQTSDGGYIIAGGDGVILMKTNGSGDSLWTKNYGGMVGYSVQQTTDGGYIVAGWRDPFVYLVKTDSTGDTLWTRTYGGKEGFSVQMTSDGGYIVAGCVWSGNNGYDVYLLKTNASGDSLWSRTFGGAQEDWAYSVRQTSDGGYIIAGYTLSFGNSYQVYLIKTDANGNVGTERGQGFEGPRVQGVKITPNPFISFATLPGHEKERFSLYDISGRKVGICKGDRIGEGLRAGVYFIRAESGDGKPVRVVKVR